MALEYTMKQGKGRVLPKRTPVHSLEQVSFHSNPKPTSNNIREDYACGHRQTVNTEIKLIIFFAAKDREALYSQQKHDRELTVA